jgi:Flp pilus assembly protein TadD
MSRKRRESPLGDGFLEELEAGSGGDTPSSGGGADPAPLEGSPSRGPSEAERHFAEGRRFDREGRFDEAAAAYRRVVALDPGHVRARNNLGVLLDRRGAHEAAAEHFRTALEREPENPELLGNLGAALGGLGRYDEAERWLRKAARLEPTRSDVRANLGILHFRRGLYAQAEEELKWVCQEDPDHATAHVFRGEALNRLDRADEALDVLERASHLQPRNPRIFHLMGILYDRKHLSEEATVMYRRARELATG